MSPKTSRLYFSRRRMLNRLSFNPTPVHGLLDASTDQDLGAAAEILFDLRNRGLASWEPGGWTITDAGVAAMATSGVIYQEDAGR